MLGTFHKEELSYVDILGAAGYDIAVFIQNAFKFELSTDISWGSSLEESYCKIG